MNSYKQKCLVLVYGAPYSGRSEWAREKIKSNNGGFVLDIRDFVETTSGMYPQQFFDTAPPMKGRLRRIFDKWIEFFIADNDLVFVIDDMLLPGTDRAKEIILAAQLQGAGVLEVFIPFYVDAVVRQNQAKNLYSESMLYALCSDIEDLSTRYFNIGDASLFAQKEHKPRQFLMEMGTDKPCVALCNIEAIGELADNGLYTVLKTPALTPDTEVIFYTSRTELLAIDLSNIADSLRKAFDPSVIKSYALLSPYCLPLSNTNTIESEWVIELYEDYIKPRYNLTEILDIPEFVNIWKAYGYEPAIRMTL